MVKSLRPVGLMSFELKTFEKLVDKDSRDGVFVNSPLHRNHYVYET